MRKERQALDFIRKAVRAGLDDAYQIFLDVTENLFAPGELDDQWVRDEIDREFARKAEEAKSWPEVTDCDRLDRVFAELEAGGVLVARNAGLTNSDALEIVEDTFADAVEDGEDPGYVGYCYYHGQDLAGVVADGRLYLGFGKRVGTEGVTDETIGRRIQRAFADAGFTVDWDGKAGRRILLTGVRWLRRMPLD